MCVVEFSRLNSADSLFSSRGTLWHVRDLGNVSCAIELLTVGRYEFIFEEPNGSSNPGAWVISSMKFYEVAQIAKICHCSSHVKSGQSTTSSPSMSQQG